MSSLKELTEDTTDRQDIRSRVAHLKTYAFFVFYQPSAVSHSHPVLQVRSRLGRRCTSSWGTEQTGPTATGRCSCSSTTWKRRASGPRACSILKWQARRVRHCISRQGKNRGLLLRGKTHGTTGPLSPIGNRPRTHTHRTYLPAPPFWFCHLHRYPHSYAGWNSSHFGDINSLSLLELQQAASRWIHSSLERVDVWSLSISLQEGGRLHRQVGKSF